MTERQSRHEDPVLEALAARIRARIQERGLTVSDVQRACGVTWVTAAAWTKGTKYPSTPNLPGLLEVLGMTADELLGIAGGQEPPFPAWRAFLELPEAKSASPSEIATLRGIAWPTGRTPTVSSYLVALSALRSTEAREG